MARVYSCNRRTKDEILEELKLPHLLKHQGLSVSYPIQDSEGSYLQRINAPEGVRFMVLFSFAEGAKVRFLSNEMCAIVGTFMANMHKRTQKLELARVSYSKKVM